MAFYFDRRSRIIPQYLTDCTKVDGTSSELFNWAEKVDHLANTLFWISVIMGLLTGLVLFSVDFDNFWWVALVVLLLFVINGLINYFILHVIAVLINALASIVHNTDVTANVALLEASANPNITIQKPASPTPSYSGRSSKPAPMTKRVCRCGKCGIERHSEDEFCPNCGSTMKTFKEEPIKQ